MTLVPKNLFREGSISEERDIPINKGHFHLETPERIEVFCQKLAEGWEERYAEYRRLWRELPEKRQVRSYPLLVDLELSKVCNLRCAMCPTTTINFEKEINKGYMDFELIKKIIDEVEEKVFAVRLSYLGEATLHKDFVEIATYVKSHHIGEVSFLTNGWNLDVDFFERLAMAGIDWITVSVDGLDKEYNQVRKPLVFRNILANLKAIHKFKQKKGLTKPLIKIQGVWPAIRPNPEKYYNTIAPWVDLIAYNPLIDTLDKDKDIVYEENFSCPQVYQRLTVGFDGRVMGCTNDVYTEEIVGNVNEDSIYEVWHGEKLKRMRQLHAEKDGFLQIGKCRKCFYPRNTMLDEKAYVNGREIRIENYINRKQTIGE